MFDSLLLKWNSRRRWSTHSTRFCVSIYWFLIWDSVKSEWLLYLNCLFFLPFFLPHFVVSIGGGALTLHYLAEMFIVFVLLSKWAYECVALSRIHTHYSIFVSLKSKLLKIHSFNTNGGHSPHACICLKAI